MPPSVPSDDPGPGWTRQRWLLAVGALAFALAIYFSLTNLPPRTDEFNWGLLLLVLVVLAPLTVLLGGLEYAATGRLLGFRIGVMESLTISVVSSAANLLPIPGAYLVRARALMEKGSTTRRSAASPLAVGVTWIATAALVAGVWSVVTQPSGFAVIVLIGGVGAMAIALGSLRSLLGAWAPGPILGVLAVELATVLVSAARYQLVLEASGFEANFAQGLVLALSTVLASAVGIIPGGLGLREALAAFFAPLASLPAASGALASIINRIIGLLALALIALFVMLRKKPLDPADGSA